MFFRNREVFLGIFYSQSSMVFLVDVGA